MFGLLVCCRASSFFRLAAVPTKYVAEASQPLASLHLLAMPTVSQHIWEDRMRTQDSEIEALLQRARNGCQEAARQILELCSNHVRSAVRRYLDTRLRSLIDLDDLTQDVWTNFFEHILPARSFNSVPHLRCFLQGMARITVARAHRKHL